MSLTKTLESFAYLQHIIQMEHPQNARRHSRPPRGRHNLHSRDEIIRLRASAIPKQVVVPPSYDSFFFPVRKSGYSGAATYTRHHAIIPLKAEEGLSGVLPPKPPSSAAKRFMESQGTSVHIMMNAKTALELGAPIRGIVAFTSTDKAGRSVPAPGRGALTVAQQVPIKNPEQPNPSTQLQAPLHRFDTARPSHFESAIYTHPDPNHNHDHPSQPEERLQRQHQQHDPKHTDTVDASFQPRTGSQHSKRSSRPPSTRSTSSQPEHHLRPHPLIRRQSYGHVGTIKPAPLAPLTVRPCPQPTSSTPQSLNDGLRNHFSTSPTSIHTTSSSAEAPHPPHDRRTSFSSTRSVRTAPTIVHEPVKAHDRSRTAVAHSQWLSHEHAQMQEEIPYYKVQGEVVENYFFS
ncbi:hypothetical protein K443DRAFT_12633 [Laccaria amethystina LaAM-08-1]|uniref:Uncharacterized protein n=1 Tax=Laccaria amethystina LaAM-08-1 TaxID=1095629 RepID=A0A0C9X817_9AGAR|nr:hypothetical protein K443DRAFT_12633 [Laccaria amethystina LaAM-08-1]